MNQCKIKGKDVTVYTLTEVSKIVGITSRALRRWEKNCILPEATVQMDMFSPLLGACKRRYYIEEQIIVLGNWIKRVRPNKGVTITEKSKNILHEEWNKVTDKFLVDIGEKT